MTTRTLPSSDFYGLERTLEPSELAVLHAVRTFMRDEVEPIINDYWTRAKFPFQILDGFRELGIAGLPYEGYGCPGHRRTLDGMVFMDRPHRPVDRHVPRRPQRAGDRRSTSADPTSNATAGYLAWPASNRSARSG